MTFNGIIRDYLTGRITYEEFRAYETQLRRRDELQTAQATNPRQMHALHAGTVRQLAQGRDQDGAQGSGCKSDDE